jgi:hypothetical protein
MDLYDPDKARQVTETGMLTLARIISEMRTKVNNNPGVVKSSTLEMFAADLDGLFHDLTVDLLPLL